MSTEKVVRPLAEAIHDALKVLWLRHDPDKVTYALCVEQVERSFNDGFANFSKYVGIGHFHLGRALNYARTVGLVNFDGEILWEDAYYVDDELIIQPGEHSDWRTFGLLVLEQA